jgi:hypothetical protein
VAKIEFEDLNNVIMDGVKLGAFADVVLRRPELSGELQAALLNREIALKQTHRDELHGASVKHGKVCATQTAEHDDKTVKLAGKVKQLEQEKEGVTREHAAAVAALKSEHAKVVVALNDAHSETVRDLTAQRDALGTSEQAAELMRAQEVEKLQKEHARIGKRLAQLQRPKTPVEASQ